MADLNDAAEWGGIYQIETTDPVVGGTPDPETGQGMSNIPHLLLANRTKWLKQQIENFGIKDAGIEPTLASPDDITKTGIYADSGYTYMHFLRSDATDQAVQLRVSNTGVLSFRRKKSGSWSSWRTSVYVSDDLCTITASLVDMSGDVVAQGGMPRNDLRAGLVTADANGEVTTGITPFGFDNFPTYRRSCLVGVALWNDANQQLFTALIHSTGASDFTVLNKKAIDRSSVWGADYSFWWSPSTGARQLQWTGLDPNTQYEFELRGMKLFTDSASAL